MTDPVAITIVMAIQGVIVAGINGFIAIRNHAETKQDIAGVAGKLEQTKTEIDGRMSELLVAAKAQGAQEQLVTTRRELLEDRKQTREDIKSEKAL